MRAIRIFLIGVVLLGLGASVYFMRRDHRDADVVRQAAKAEPWSVSSVDAKSPVPALLWTGELGVRIGRDGTGVGPDGAMLPAFVPWNYQTTGEEKIIPIANPLAFSWLIDGEPIGNDELRQYRQTLDFKTSTLTTEYWATRGNRRIQVRSETWIANPKGLADPTINTRWELKPTYDARIEFQPISASEQGTRGSTTFHDEAAYYQTQMTFKLGSAELDSNESLTSPIPVENGQTLVWTRQVAITPATRSRIAIPSTERTGITWTDADADIEIDGPVEDQQAIRSQLWYLRTAYRGISPARPSPLMLSGDKYFGHVFWDADVWVSPAMALLEPGISQHIANYRLGMAKQAEQNALVAGIANAVQFPWESSVTGKETVPGPSHKEIHITGSVVWSLQRASDLGFVAQTEVNRLGRMAANYYLGRSVLGRGGKRELKDVMSPDENHVGDNDLYTNALAQWLCDRYRPDARAEFYLPRDDKMFLTYDDDRLRGYKQAAALLTVFPLEFPPAVSEAALMYDRYATKTTTRGPAMSESIHSIVASRIGRPDEAYGLWRKSWKDFSPAPLLVFAEKRNLSNSYFTTGAAGCLQAVLYGMAGIEFRNARDPKASAVLPLRNGKWLCITPRLPRAWKRLRIRNLTVLGRRYDLAVDKTSASIREVIPEMRRTKNAAERQTNPAK